ncbi:transcriptional regulator [Clostridium sp. P21]|uniref:Transcriptional regulator n=1 Tax=Clostridium muellerianum TaxID=2716538 RepID=A0A7Y0HQ33_9CLOT|nr:M56 family metallopeptidase [Clostridium muellerianum]NMM64815.1 transcriptional regulator [Clostridium muellerianum]
MDILIKSFLWVLRASIAASIAALLIILILKLFNKKISVRFQHALWIIVLLRLIIPVEFQSNLSMLNLLHQTQQSSSNIEDKSTMRNMTYAASDFLRDGKVQLKYKSKNQISQVGQFSEKVVYKKENTIKEYVTDHILGITSCVWLTGVFIMSIFLLMAKGELQRKTLKMQKLNDLEITKLLNECKKKANINIDIPVYICDSFKSPCTLGIVKPKIYIPKCVCTKNNLEQLYYILLHELIHYKRKDLICNFLTVFATILHWFNPIVWLCMKRIKLQREYACDAYVLEIIGEEHVENYGMTLINFSKLLSNNRVPQLAVCFETKNQIKRRIKMIKNFKKGSYKMSAVAVACCVLASGAILTSAVNAKGMKLDNAYAVVSSNNSLVKNQNSKFLIDARVKAYDNLKRAEESVGFKIKAPDYIPTNYTVGSIQVIKISDKDYSLKMSMGNDNNGIEFLASKVNMEQCLKQITEDANKESLLTVPDELKKQNKEKVEVSKEAMNVSGINGSNITIKSTLPGDYTTVTKFFAWQNEGMWYGIEYNMEKQGNKGFAVGTPIGDVGKIASSIKYIQDIKNVNYSVQKDISAEIATLSIYDKEDLKKAKELLKFNPKLPLSINKDIIIEGSSAGLTRESDTKNKKLDYELDAWYKAKVGVVTFMQSKNSKVYGAEKGRVNSINIAGKEVFKYETYEEGEGNKKIKEYIYNWEENGVYYEVSTIEGNGNPDEIAKEFVNSKSID